MHVVVLPAPSTAKWSMGEPLAAPVRHDTSAESAAATIAAVTSVGGSGVPRMDNAIRPWTWRSAEAESVAETPTVRMPEASAAGVSVTREPLVWIETGARLCGVAESTR